MSKYRNSHGDHNRRAIGSNKIEVGDLAGIGIPVVDRKTGDTKGMKIVALGKVVEIFQPGPRQWLRARLWWDTPGDETRAFLHTGKDDYVYLNELTLVRKAKK